MVLAEAVVSQQEVSVTVRSQWRYRLQRQSARVTVRRRAAPRHSVRDLRAPHSPPRRTACVSVSISWPWERRCCQSRLPTVSCALIFTSSCLVFMASQGPDHRPPGAADPCSPLAASGLNRNYVAFEARHRLARDHVA